MLVVLFSTVLLLSGFAEVRAYDGAHSLRRDQISAGSHVFVVAPSQEGSTPATSLLASECETATEHPAVKRSGAIFATRFERIAHTAEQVRVVELSPSSLPLLAPLPLSGNTFDGGGRLAVATFDLSSALRLSAGSEVSLGGDDVGAGAVTIAGIAGPSIRLPEYSRALFIGGSPLGAADACLLEVLPTLHWFAKDGGFLSLFSSPPGSITTRGVAPPNRSPAELYRDLRVPALPYVSFVIVLLVVSIAVRARAAEWALYASFGVTPSGRVVLIAAEMTALLGAALLLASCLTMVVVPGLGMASSGLSAVGAALLLSWVASFAAGLLGAFIGSLGQTSQMLKE